MLDEATVEKVKASLRGELIQPHDERYDDARTIWNAMIDKRPALIARCSGTADVIAAVNFAREHDLVLSVRGGGHNIAGTALCDDGLTIDLSGMKGIHVDLKTRTVRAQTGCNLGDLDRETQVFGLAVPAGIVTDTGIAGLTLGGGFGWLTRRYGYTCDNLISADVVTADGTVLTASDKENADLFWGLRGGGGNFGVVTSFLFKAHPVDAVYAGVTVWPLERARELMRWYGDFSRQAPTDLYGFFAFLTVPPAPPFPATLHGRTMCGIVWCYTGSLDAAEKAFAPMRSMAPAFEHLGSMPLPVLNSMFDALYPPGQQWYWKGDFVKKLTDEAIERHLEYGSNPPTPQSTMHLYPIDGAVHEVGAADTAWSCRDAAWSMVIVGVDPNPANAQKITDWARGYWRALHPYSDGGAYVNFMMEEGSDRVRATYGDNYERLVDVKTKYDPANLFRTNQNIEPKGQ